MKAGKDRNFVFGSRLIYIIRMAKHNLLGKKGEDIAALFLKEKDYLILEKNWRWAKAEVDIIALKGGILVFVEVKTRASDFFGAPEEFVDERKEALMARAASKYMSLREHEGEIRFDIVSVILAENKKPVVEHFEDAFFPGLFGE